jgi:hypothetical protein
MHLDPVVLSRVQFAWVIAWHILMRHPADLALPRAAGRVADPLRSACRTKENSCTSRNRQFFV